jgi:hypothetical protein
MRRTDIAPFRPDPGLSSLCSYSERYGCLGHRRRLTCMDIHDNAALAPSAHAAMIQAAGLRGIGGGAAGLAGLVTGASQEGPAGRKPPWPVSSRRISAVSS